MSGESIFPPVKPDPEPESWDEPWARAADLDVSIIIPCFNRADCTRECWAALNRTLPPALSHEVIFIDNGSQDDTADFLRGLGDRIRLIQHNQNLGFARACNDAARTARGRRLMFLNNDTIPLPGWLEPLVALLDNEPRIAIVAGKLLYPDGRVQHAGVIVNEWQGDGVVRLEHVHRFSASDAPWVNRQTDFQCVTGACLLIRRMVFGACGGFDEAFVNGYEDIDLCFRVRELGHRIVYCADSVLVHLESASDGRHQHDIPNSARFTRRWVKRLVPDEITVYDYSGRRELFLLRGELTRLQARAAAIQALPRPAADPAEPPKAPPVKSGLARFLRRWLGVDRGDDATEKLSENFQRHMDETAELAREMESFRQSLHGMQQVLEYLVKLTERPIAPDHMAATIQSFRDGLEDPPLQ